MYWKIINFIIRKNRTRKKMEPGNQLMAKMKTTRFDVDSYAKEYGENAKEIMTTKLNLEKIFLSFADIVSEHHLLNHKLDSNNRDMSYDYITARNDVVYNEAGKLNEYLIFDGGELLGNLVIFTVEGYKPIHIQMKLKEQTNHVDGTFIVAVNNGDGSFYQFNTSRFKTNVEESFEEETPENNQLSVAFSQIFNNLYDNESTLYELGDKKKVTSKSMSKFRNGVEYDSTNVKHIVRYRSMIADTIPVKVLTNMWMFYAIHKKTNERFRRQVSKQLWSSYAGLEWSDSDDFD